jgi:hypothetical protein
MATRVFSIIGLGLSITAFLGLPLARRWWGDAYHLKNNHARIQTERSD